MTKSNLHKPVEFISLPNIIKGKVGSRGLSEDTLKKAQRLMKEHDIDFGPQAKENLQILMDSIKKAQNVQSLEEKEMTALISEILSPCIELNSHGSMFRFPLVSEISYIVIRFLKNIQNIDEKVLEIFLAYHATARAIIQNKLYGDGGDYGQELIQSLDAACNRYIKTLETT